MALLNKFILVLVAAFLSFSTEAATTIKLNGKSLSAWNGTSLSAWNGSTGVIVSAASFDFVENFETLITGYDNSGWTTYGSGNPAANSVTMGFSAGQGSQSLYAATGAVSGAFRSRSATGEVWFFWKMYCVSGVVDDWHFYGDSGDASVLWGFSSGKMQLRVAGGGGGTSTDSGSAFPLDQWVAVWVRYKPGSGSCEADAYYATSPFTRPGSPQCTLSGLTNTTEADRPWWLSRSTYAVAWDRIIINSTSVGSNP